MRAATKDPHTTSIRLVWPFLDLARKHGHDVSKVAEQLGLTERELNDPETRVSQQCLAKLLSSAVSYSGQRDIGLQAAYLADSRQFGITEYLARTQPTVRSALDTYDRYLPLLGDAMNVSVEVCDANIIMRLRFDPQLEIHEAAYEFALAIGVLRSRRVTGISDLAPISVHFMHAQPASIERHKALFRCPIYFGADVTHIVFPKQNLELRLPGRDPVLSDLLARHADAQLEHFPRQADLAAQVRMLLGTQVRLSEASAPRVAKRLGIGVRTLSRRLDVERTSFREILDEVRKQIAIRELAHGARSIAALSDRLGYATPQAFHRAFKRWTGRTPLQMRTGK
jgi:AraC-like DNA-binding protein